MRNVLTLIVLCIQSLKEIAMIFVVTSAGLRWLPCDSERCQHIKRQQMYNICLELSQFFPFSPYIGHITLDVLNLSYSQRGVHNGKTSDTLL